MKGIQIRNLAFAYDQDPIFQDLSLDIEEGVLCGILGPNGVGKSTLLKLLAGQLKANAGRMFVGEKEIHSGSAKALSKMIASVSQDSSPVYGYTASEIVMMARFVQQNRILFEKTEDWMAVEEALKETDITHLADRPITQLSGGERQRVYLARALAQETPVLLLDEPASHLDLKHQVHLYDLLKRLQIQKKKTIVMVTHDLNLAAHYCDTILMLGKNRKIIYGTVKEVINQDLIKTIFDIDCHIISSNGLSLILPIGLQKENDSK